MLNIQAASFIVDARFEATYGFIDQAHLKSVVWGLHKRVISEVMSPAFAEGVNYTREEEFFFLVQLLEEESLLSFGQCEKVVALYRTL